jgi:hypothetical protein
MLLLRSLLQRVVAASKVQSIVRVPTQRMSHCSTDLGSVLWQEVLASVACPTAGVACGREAAAPVIEAIHACHSKD